MANATLVINDSEKFMDDIWQYEGDFSKSDWKGSIEEWSKILNELYEIISTEDFYYFITKLSKEIPEIEDFGDDKLYQLGDLINMLNSIDVEINEKKKENKKKKETEIKYTEYNLLGYNCGFYDYAETFNHLDKAHGFAKRCGVKKYIIEAIYYDTNKNEIGTEIVYDSKIRKEN